MLVVGNDIVKRGRDLGIVLAGQPSRQGGRATDRLRTADLVPDDVLVEEVAHGLHVAGVECLQPGSDDRGIRVFHRVFLLWRQRRAVPNAGESTPPRGRWHLMSHDSTNRYKAIDRLVTQAYCLA